MNAWLSLHNYIYQYIYKCGRDSMTTMLEAQKPFGIYLSLFGNVCIYRWYQPLAALVEW